MNYKVPQLEPYVGKEEIANLTKVIKNKWLTEGPFCKEFVELIQKKTGAKYACLVNNGTLGLYLGLKALGVKEGDEVILPDCTFNATGSSIAFTGAKPVFVDVYDYSWNIDPNKIEQYITEKTKVIIPVHVYGQSANMDMIMEIAKKYNLKVLEDAAQGFGVYFDGKHTGTIGDIGLISFFADKTITTGEGGILLTNNEELYKKIKMLRNQGRENSGVFIHPELGMNFRLTDLQAAVGVAQIKKFDKILKKKTENYNLYKKLLTGVEEVQFLMIPPWSNFVPFRANIKAWDAERLLNYLEDNVIQTRRVFYPLHLQPCYRQWKYNDASYPESKKAYAEGLSLPVFYNLTKEQITYVCNKIKEFYKVK